MKKVMVILITGVMIFAMAGCGAQADNAAEAPAAATTEAPATDTTAEPAAEETAEPAEASEEATDAAFEETLAALGDTGNAEEASGEAAAEDTADTASADDAPAGGSSAALPPYEYPGPELFYYNLYKYLTDELSKDYEPADVSIPNVLIVETDMSNRDDIRVYGDFWIYNYKLEGDTLMMESGGSYPGVIHLNNDFEVTGFDKVEDGSNWDPSAKKLFGKHYDGLLKLMDNSEQNEATRMQIIANYVAANNLKITKVQDYGWDPVELPPENIDNFYSKLD